MSVAVESDVERRRRVAIPDRLVRWWPWLAFGAAGVTAFAAFLYQGRGLTFFFDELIWIRERRNPSVSAFLSPHVGHLSLIPVAIYQLFFRVFGLVHYTPYRIFVLVLHVSIAALLFASLRRRVADVVALALAVMVLFLGGAWQDLLWPFQMGFLLSVGAGLAAFLCLDRDTTRGDVGASVSVAVALASSSIGIAVAGAVGLELVLRQSWRRLWIAAGPVALYLVWWAFYGDSKTEVSSVGDFVRFLVSAAGAAVGALVGAGDVVGQWLLLAVVPLLVVGIRRAGPDRRPRVLALIAMPIAYWTLLALARSTISLPGQSRYLYAGAVFVALALGECLRGVQVGKLGTLALVVLVAYAMSWNLGKLDYGRRQLERASARVELGAIDIGARGVDPAYARLRGPLPLETAQFAAAFHEFGSPGAGPAAIRRQPERVREQADAFLVHAAVIHLQPPTPPHPPAPVVHSDTPAAAEPPDCVTLAPLPAQPLTAELAPRPGSLRVASGGAPVDVSIRNFGDTYAQAPLGTVPAGQARDVPVPGITAGPWHVRVHSPGPVTVCGA